jgi:catechol 2,3-dioxygenase-like lactoylglutathione lyase family enzyme
MIGRWHGTVIDCADPSALAGFYEQLLGFQRVQDEPDWVVIGDAPDRPGLGFNRVADFRPPVWDDAEHPQQMHLDLRVEDLERATAGAVELGARPRPGGNPHVQILEDPAGHPFCLVQF